MLRTAEPPALYNISFHSKYIFVLRDTLDKMPKEQKESGLKLPSHGSWLSDINLHLWENMPQSRGMACAKWQVFKSLQKACRIRANLQLNDVAEGRHHMILPTRRDLKWNMYLLQDLTWWVDTTRAREKQSCKEQVPS